MTPSLLVTDAAAAFWDAAVAPASFPRDMRQIIPLAAPASVVLLAALHVSRVEAWLDRQGSQLTVGVPDRPLRACLIAHDGAGFIFIDATDSDNQQRFSLAHELAHFLLDYAVPRRQAAAALGEDILDVLDGHRPSSLDDRVGALLTGTTARPFVHLLGRDEGGARADEIVRSEALADALALELLAPWAVVAGRIEGAGMAGDQSAVARLLVAAFGLPDLAATRYASNFVPDLRPVSALLQHVRAVELSNVSPESLVDRSAPGMHTP